MKLQRAGRIIFMSVTFIWLLIGMIGTAYSAAPEEPVAIKGYDTVAYFTESKAVKGTEEFTSSWHGMTWLFQSKENRDLFAASPEKYTPQYDGWCAWAMTEYRKAVTDPEVWKIVDGKLYLNCSMSAYEKWSRDIPGHIKIADENWKKMQSEK
ncbi:MAG: YHS domain-containing (seleno)protein [Nitrospirota bacterium]